MIVLSGLFFKLKKCVYLLKYTTKKLEKKKKYIKNHKKNTKKYKLIKKSI